MRHQRVVTLAVIEAGQGRQGQGAAEGRPLARRMRANQLVGKQEVHADAEQEPQADILEVLWQPGAKRLEDKGEQRVAVGIDDVEPIGRVQQVFMVAGRPRHMTPGVPAQHVLAPVGFHGPADPRRVEHVRVEEDQEQQDGRCAQQHPVQAVEEARRPGFRPFGHFFDYRGRQTPGRQRHGRGYSSSGNGQIQQKASRWPPSRQKL